MADDLRAFDAWFDADAWPSAPCPACKIGDLHPIASSIKTVTTTSYDDHENDEDWEPDWKHGYFHGILYCGRPACREKVVVSGHYQVVMQGWDRAVDTLLLKYAIPALPLVIPPPKTPKDVIAGIEAANRIVWADPAGAANGLRRAVEAILNHQKVRKTQTTRAGKRRRLSAHERIGLLKVQKPAAATSLEAVKWLGNEGSHSSQSLTPSDCIESAEYLNHAVRVLYDQSEAALLKKAKTVNKSKGRRRSA